MAALGNDFPVVSQYTPSENQISYQLLRSTLEEIRAALLSESLDPARAEKLASREGILAKIKFPISISDFWCTIPVRSRFYTWGCDGYRNRSCAANP